MNFAQGAAALGILAVLFGEDILTLFREEPVRTLLFTLVQLVAVDCS